MRLATLTSALLLVGCADSGDEGMFVLNNTAVTGATCTLTGVIGQPFTSHGYINARSTIGYVLTPLIQSRVQINIGGGSGVMMQQPGTIDTTQRTIALRGADVKLTVKATEIEQGGVYMTNSTEREIAPFSVLFSGSIPPGGTANVAFEVMSASQIRDVVNGSGANIAVQNLRAEILAEVTIKGSMGGNEIAAVPFHYPISVCTDCVIVNAGSCETFSGTASIGNACNPFQDGVLTCCTDDTGGLVCPAQ